MTSTTYDDDVDFETDEETSEFEEELEDIVNTVTVKLPSQKTTNVASKTKKSVSSPELDVLTVASKTHELNGSTIGDDSSLKKSSKIPKEPSQRLIENGYNVKCSETISKTDTSSEPEKNEVKEIMKEKTSSKTKLDSDASDEVTPAKKHKEKSEKRKSKEESKKLLSEVGSTDEIEVSVKKSSKSKKEKSLDQDENSGSSRKRDKYADEEGYTSKSKKDKNEKTQVEEMSALHFVGEVGEVKEKKKKKKSTLESESKYLEMPSSSSPSSSSSDLEKLRNENSKTEELDDQSKMVKTTKKKSKKSVESNEVEIIEHSKVVDEPVEQVQTVDSNIEIPAETKECFKEEEKQKITDDEKLEIEKICEKYKDEEFKSSLRVESPQMERDPTSPDHITQGATAAGRIEQTRNYLKALTPEDGCRSASDDEKSGPKTSAVFEIAKHEELEEENKNKDGEEIVWESKPESIESKGKIVENEDSDFTYRRKSMDDFIKKILAEAREENLKLKDDNDKAKKPPTPKAKPQAKPVDTYRDDDDEEEFLEKKSKSKTLKSSDNQPMEVNKELDDINKYFAKRHEEMDGDLNIENSQKSKLDKNLNVKENGYLAKNELDDDDFTVRHKKTQLSNYLDDDENAKPKQPSSTSLVKKPIRNVLMNGDASYDNEDDHDETADITDFLAKFKRERQALFGGPGAVRIREFEAENKRNAETDDLIRDKTRNIKSVIDQQMDICQNVRSVSKQLDDLEKELREVRQISLDRRSRMEAMESAVNAEYKMYVIEHQAAVDRVKDKKPIQKFTQEVKDQMIANIQQQQAAKAKKSDRYMTSDDVTPSIRRRVGSVSSQAALMDEQDNFFSSSSPASSSPYHSFAPSKGRGSTDRDPYLSSYLNVDRKRDGSGGSRSRLSFVDNGSDFDDLPVQSATQSILFSKPRSRASVATMDTSSSISADDFLAKMRSKYSFLNPAGDDNSSNRTSLSSKNSAYRPLTGGHDSYRSRLEEPSSLSYLSVKNNAGRGLSPSSIYDMPGSRYSLTSGTAGRYSGLTRSSHTPSIYEPPKSRRAASVSDARSSVQFDRNLGGYTTGGYYGYGGSTGGTLRYSVGTPRYSDSSSQHYTPSHSSSTSGGEFKSRFLDKVREKRSSVGSSSSSHDLADRVRARLSGNKSTASYDLPPPPSSTKHANLTQPAVSVSVENSTVEAN